MTNIHVPTGAALPVALGCCCAGSSLVLTEQRNPIPLFDLNAVEFADTRPGRQRTPSRIPGEVLVCLYKYVRVVKSNVLYSVRVELVIWINS